MATGGCVCGQLRYEAEGAAVQKAICHCITCRHLSGSAFTTNLLYPEEKFRFIAGTPKTFTTKQDSGMMLTYRFCGNCGANIYKSGDLFAGLVILQAGSLDEPDSFENAGPQAELYVSKRVGWLKGLEGKAQLQEFQ